MNFRGRMRGRHEGNNDRQDQEHSAHDQNQMIEGFCLVHRHIPQL